MSILQIPTDHEHVQMNPGRRSGLPVMIGIHSTTLGPAIGGLRIKHYATPFEGMVDCMRLSQAMTYKAAAIDNGTGGGKAVVPLPEGMTMTPEVKQAILLDVAEQIQACKAHILQALTSVLDPRTWTSCFAVRLGLAVAAPRRVVLAAQPKVHSPA